MTVAAPATVQDVLDRLGIDLPVLIAINEQHEVDTNTRLQSDDTVIVFEAAVGG